MYIMNKNDYKKVFRRKISKEDFYETHNGNYEIIHSF